MATTIADKRIPILLKWFAEIINSSHVKRKMTEEDKSLFLERAESELSSYLRNFYIPNPELQTLGIIIFLNIWRKMDFQSKYHYFSEQELMNLCDGACPEERFTKLSLAYHQRMHAKRLHRVVPSVAAEPLSTKSRSTKSRTPLGRPEDAKRMIDAFVAEREGKGAERKETVCGYEAEKLIGTGSYGKIYRVHDERGDKYALKVQERNLLDPDIIDEISYQLSFAYPDLLPITKVIAHCPSDTGKVEYSCRLR